MRRVLPRARLVLVAFAAVIGVGSALAWQPPADRPHIEPQPAPSRLRQPFDPRAGMQDPLPGLVLPRDIASYDIEARLDADTKTVSATARIVWNNPSPADTVPDLWFHLYLNAFRDRDSTFWRESHGQLRGMTMPTDGWGSSDVTALRLADGTDLLPTLTYAAPDDGNAKDRTVARVVLPNAVPPGGRVELDVA